MNLFYRGRGNEFVIFVEGGGRAFIILVKDREPFFAYFHDGPLLKLQKKIKRIIIIHLYLILCVSLLICCFLARHCLGNKSIYKGYGHNISRDFIYR